MSAGKDVKTPWFAHADEEQRHRDRIEAERRARERKMLLLEGVLDAGGRKVLVLPRRLA